MLPTSNFLFVTCQPGAEALLKADIAAHAPALRFSFSRPGFITFKAPEPIAADVPCPSVFARAWGVCVGPVAPGEEPLAHLKAMNPGEDAALHIFGRDPWPTGDEPPGEDLWARDEALASTLSAPWPINQPPRRDQLVLDLIAVDPGRLWLGAHQHNAGRRPTPGGRPPRLTTPPEAPSRVWQKMEEALWAFGASPGAEDTVLDIGCSPGGGTWSLLGRGARVIGVDAAEVAPQVGEHPRFKQRRTTFERLDPASLPADLGWLIFDVNLSPMLTLGHLQHFGRQLGRLHSALITLKLNRPGHVERLPWMLDQIRKIGLTELRATQLFHNRSEIVVFARRARVGRR